MRFRHAIGYNILYAYVKEAITISTEHRTKKILLIVGICIAALALAAVLGVFLWGSVIKSGDTVMHNVYAADTDLSGMTAQQVQQTLEEGLAADHVSRKLSVVLPDRTLVFRPEKANIQPDTAAMAQAAVAYGRDGSSFAALKTYLSRRNSAYVLDLQDYLQVDTDYIRDLIDRAAKDVQQEKVQSEIVMDEEQQLLTITLGYNGIKLDADALYEAVLDAYTKKDVSEITFSYDVDPYDIVDLQPYYDKYCKPARNAYYNSADQTMMPEVVGYGFDLIAVNAQIALAKDGAVLEVPLDVMEPTVTVEEYNNKNYPDVLATYRSAHTYNANRTTNLKLACEAIDGTVLKPGEVFSFNNVVGERTVEKGYKEGIVYADGGESEMEEGGGICQVVSSVYMCALTADLQIVERQPHMYPVGYVKPGCDATVYWGAVDFKFKNSNSTPIKINASVSGGYVTMTFMGTNEHDYTVSMTSQLVQTIPYEEVEKVDPTKPEGYWEQTQQPHTGYIYWSYKNYYDLSGNFLRSEKCAISEYTKYDSIITVGPNTEKPDEDEEEEDLWEQEQEQTPARPEQKPEQTEQERAPSFGSGASINLPSGKKNYRN